MEKSSKYGSLWSSNNGENRSSAAEFADGAGGSRREGKCDVERSVFLKTMCGLCKDRRDRDFLLIHSRQMLLVLNTMNPKSE